MRRSEILNSVTVDRGAAIFAGSVVSGLVVFAVITVFLIAWITGPPPPPTDPPPREVTLQGHNLKDVRIIEIDGLPIRVTRSTQTSVSFFWQDKLDGGAE
jgi:hypothetical protein